MVVKQLDVVSRGPGGAEGHGDGAQLVVERLLLGLVFGLLNGGFEGDHLRRLTGQRVLPVAVVRHLAVLRFENGADELDLHGRVGDVSEGLFEFLFEARVFFFLAASFDCSSSSALSFSVWESSAASKLSSASSAW